MSELAVWYGILFREQLTAEHPALPSWAVEMLDDEVGDTRTTEELENRGYGGTDLTWIEYSSGDVSCYYGLAVRASVQRTTCRTGKVDTCRPDDITAYWADSLGQAAQILGCDTAEFSWYQTSCWPT